MKSVHADHCDIYHSAVILLTMFSSTSSTVGGEGFAGLSVNEQKGIQAAAMDHCSSSVCLFSSLNTLSEFLRQCIQ